MPSIDRRLFLRAGLAAAAGGALASACSRESTDFVRPTGDEVRAAEAARHPGRVREFHLLAHEGHADLGGPAVRTWMYGDRLPGEPIRVRAGEVVRARLTNRLPQDTTVHWHGLALRNDADGVPGVTQPPIPAGGELVYEFTASHPGTYWFHPHHGPQLDRGLYAPLIVEDPAEPLSYDEEWVVVLDDWLDGVTGTPDEVLAELTSMAAMGHAASTPSGGHGGHGGHGASGATSDGGAGGGHGGHGDMAMPTPTPSASAKWPHMMMNAESDLLGGDAGDVYYPHFLVNGKIPASPETRTAKPGTRLRIRLINAGGDTAFRVALGGHAMTVTHTDGYAVAPVETDALLIGMGERYDVLVTLKDGVFPLVALAEGKRALGRALVRTAASARAPRADVRPAELDGRLVGYDALVPADAVRLAGKTPDRTITLTLTGSMAKYDWAINGKKFDPKVVEPVRPGERVRLSFVNRSLMWHPMHLHGHTFALGRSGARKDTAIVLPGATVNADFEADNPGLWMIHCHNVYHAEAGMMTLLGYQA
ncbi:multicopper oxidase family protein [Microtetraspora sp. AC03309]|uniref:multicopper oxidase family protein n=1 Tax=Microtetraspora sp. AC03309 TaxID=2779376 RepID=UPI001E4AD54C|nr:multicopper oxidase family protein [Microtetraspora sp. AC03309]MCC5578026.1 multicopper oxidase family protein [Microtetraspora sp. AC03309]